MTDIVDTRVLDELQDAVGAEFLVELIGTFLSEAPSMMAELNRAAASDDAEALRRAAHSLKSNANTFGALQLADAARRIEMEGLGEAPSATIAALQSQLDQAATVLGARCNG